MHLPLHITLRIQDFGPALLPEQDKRRSPGRDSAEGEHLHRDARMLGHRQQVPELPQHHISTTQTGPQCSLLQNDPEGRGLGPLEYFPAPHAVLYPLHDLWGRILWTGRPIDDLGVLGSLQDAWHQHRRVVTDVRRLTLQLEIRDHPRRIARVCRSLTHSGVDPRRAEDLVALFRELSAGQLLARLDLADVRLLAAQLVGEHGLRPPARLTGVLDLHTECPDRRLRRARLIAHMFNSPYSSPLWNGWSPGQRSGSRWNLSLKLDARSP